MLFGFSKTLNGFGSLYKDIQAAKKNLVPSLESH
jgi:hypothetical protein